MIGILVLIFRIWLCEFKLREELGYRRLYLSRFVNYYFVVGIIYNFQNMTFNVILVTVFPILFLALIEWDRKFFMRLNSVPEWQEKKTWMVIERITLHLPILITSCIPYVWGFRNIILLIQGLPMQSPGLYEFMVGSNYGDFGAQIISLIFAQILIYFPFILYDKRWYDKFKWPTAKYMLILIIILNASSYIFVIVRSILLL